MPAPGRGWEKAESGADPAGRRVGQFKRAIFTLIKLGHPGVMDYTWEMFLDALSFESDLQK
uniref:Uncharacterized protein n=1 Tax=Magnetococcus massalia (strain MO-1) TaxID=451514 RepID=A0A1S7LHU6_MAGMO|nr:Protein of unknown function [Candidatus Magnetococcus massalia]